MLDKDRKRKTQRRQPGYRRGILVALACVALLIVASGLLRLFGGPAGVETAQIGGRPFRLAASNGRTIDDRSFPGRYKLLYFGYTHCRDICPMTLAALAGALELLGRKADRLQPLFVTVDPERDTATVLRTYLAGFTPRLIGLTGTPKQIAAIEREYRVTSIVRPTASGDYDLDHSAVLYLMSPDGRFVAPIRAGEPAAAMAATLAHYLS